MKSLKIGIDFDDVLFGFTQGFLEYYNDSYGTSYEKSQMKDYHFDALLGKTREEIFEHIDDFNASGKHIGVSPVTGSIESVRQIKNHKLFVISARPEQTRSNVENWLEIHFPKIFKNVFLTGVHHGPPGSSTKEKFAKDLGIDIFIEDSLNQALKISACDIPVLLIDAPWNQGSLPENITRVFSWEGTISKVEAFGNR